MTDITRPTGSPPAPTTGAATLPSISIVIPTYNNLSLLLECLESVYKLEYPRDLLEVIVVDNASGDRTPEAIATRYPNARLVQLDSNTGFAPACDRGAQEAAGEYVAFLNNDAVVAPDWLNALLDALRTGGEETVCAASRILSRDGADTEYSGASSNLFGAGRPESISGWPDLPAPATTGTPVLFASGGAMLIRRDTFLEVGGFDPSYFAYFEDVDLGWRLWVLGYRVVYAPNAIVRHIGGATGSRRGSH
ncbi:MAG: glycosyltransferase family 2 protein, partial [Chloroflexota bacterium]